jgi:hypothetical protein
MKILFFVVIACTAFSATCLAQSVYKAVGPDGKIVYTDQPLLEPNTQAKAMTNTSMRTSTVPAAETNARKLGSAQADASAAMAPKKALRKDDTRTATAGERVVPIDEATQQALITIIGFENLVTRVTRMCTDTLPTSMNKYAEMSENWTARHSALLEKKNKIMAAYPAEERARITSVIASKNDRDLALVASAHAGRRIPWCQQSVSEVNGGRMDVYNTPRIAEPLNNFRI